MFKRVALIAQIMVRHVAFQDEDPLSPNTFLKACDLNDIKKIKKLLEMGVDPNCHEEDFITGLHIAADRDFHQLGKLLLAQPRIIVNCRNDWGHTPLFQACAKDHDRMVLLLIEHSADVNIPDKNYTSPLHNCVLLRNNHLVKILLQHGAEANCENIYGKTPLYMAVLDSPNEQNIERLIKYGADVNENNGKIMPILIEGALICHNYVMLNMLTYFINCGCDVNVKDILTGRTAMHMVAISNYVPLAEVLISCGADYQAQDFQRKKPLDYAITHLNTDMIEYLKYIDKMYTDKLEDK